MPLVEVGELGLWRKKGARDFALGEGDSIVLFLEGVGNGE